MGPKRGPDDDVLKVHGQHAANAVLARRLGDVVRGYFDESRRASFGEAMRTLAGARIAYRLVPEDELARVAKSQHHEGVCLLVRPRPPLELEAFLSACPPAALAVLLDGVENPHNVGAIVRSAAHFGARAVFALGPLEPAGALARVAEGGAEAVELAELAFAGLDRIVEAGFELVGASPAAERSSFEHRFFRRTLLVVGAERAGLSARLEARLTTHLRIPGTGAVESLNASGAAAVLMAEYARQRAELSRRKS